jgi:hypothetical protein
VRAIGKNFDVNQVGFVPWKGTTEVTALTGPSFFFDEGSISQIQLLGGFSSSYEDADLSWDHSAVAVVNFQFRSSWGFEWDLLYGKNLDAGTKYTYYGASLNMFFHTSPRWQGGIAGGIEHTYNFARGYVAPYIFANVEFGWKVMDVLEVGSSGGVFREEKPDGSVEEITYNARPYFSLTPINNFNIRLYVDNLLLRSTGNLQSVIAGLLVSYNFLPKSWIYFAINDIRNRADGLDAYGNTVSGPMRIAARAGVLKIRYLYYF